jgi:hypothetical protein
MTSNFVPALSPAQLEYRRYLKSWRWWVLRRVRLWMDGNRCRMCGSAERLQVHHRDYLHRGKAWLGELFDLTTVCNSCHGDFHDGD